MKKMTQTETAINGKSTRVMDYATAMQRRNDSGLDVEVAGWSPAQCRDFRESGNLRIDALDLARWCRPAAKLGDPAAEHVLAMLYLNGLIPRVNPVEGIPMLRHSAAYGHAPSLRALGWCYAHGACVPKDRERAYRLYQYAATRGDVDAMMALEACHWAGTGTAVNHAEASIWHNAAVDAARKAPLMPLMQVDVVAWKTEA